MRISIKKSSILCLLMAICFSSYAGESVASSVNNNNIAEESAYGLAKRVSGKHASNFVFQVAKNVGKKDFFEISKKGKQVLVRGNNGISLTSGLKEYREQVLKKHTF